VNNHNIEKDDDEFIINVEKIKTHIAMLEGTPLSEHDVQLLKILHALLEEANKQAVKHYESVKP
jgi:hypothetical protein